MGRARSTEIRFSCQECSAVFFVKPSRVKGQRSPVRFCSHKCMSKFQEISARITPFACSVCCEVKDPEQFYRDKHKSRARVAACKSCYKEKAKKIKPYRREGALRSGAIKRGIAYELTREQLMSLWQKPCVYCGGEIVTVGVDRVDNTKGYVMENVVPCCATCNSMKSSMELVDFVRRCATIAARMDCNSAIRFIGKF